MGIFRIGLRQHIGGAALAIVAKGDVVKKGQVIGELGDGLGARVHSSVLGRVLRICDDFVDIEADAVQTDEFVQIEDFDSHLEAVRLAGIVGAGGAGFPSHVKFAVDLDGGTFILNAAECEPELRHNVLALREQAGLIVRGVKYAMGMVNAGRAFIAVKPKHNAMLINLIKLIKDEENIEIKFLSDTYPVGDERVIVRELMGITLEAGQLPITAGVVVSNVETIKRVAEAIELRKPVITKDFTVAGRLQGEGKVYLDEPIGAPVSTYIDDCGGALEPHGEILIGGPFTGTSGSMDSVITKTTGGIFIAMPFPDDASKFGILACECGAGEDRLKEIVAGMGGNIVASAMCKRMVEVNGRYRCDQPGNCPGQAEAVMKLRSAGADAVLVGSCED